MPAALYSGEDRSGMYLLISESLICAIEGFRVGVSGVGGNFMISDKLLLLTDGVEGVVEPVNWNGRRVDLMISKSSSSDLTSRFLFEFGDAVA